MSDLSSRAKFPFKLTIFSSIFQHLIKTKSHFFQFQVFPSKFRHSSATICNTSSSLTISKLLSLKNVSFFSDYSLSTALLQFFALLLSVPESVFLNSWKQNWTNTRSPNLHFSYKGTENIPAKTLPTLKIQIDDNLQLLSVENCRHICVFVQVKYFLSREPWIIRWIWLPGVFILAFG